MVQPRLQLTILYICTADTSVYFDTAYLPPDVKVFSCMMSSLASTTQLPSPSRPKMPLTYVVYVCGDISLTKGHLGSKGGGYISKNKLKYTELSVLMTYIIFLCKSLAHAQ